MIAEAAGKLPLGCDSATATEPAEAKATFTGTQGVTDVTSVAVLLLGLGSSVSAVTVAVFVSVPVMSAATCTTMSMVAVAALGKIPRSQVIVVVPEHVPLLGVAETKVTPGGNTSVTVTPLVVLGIAGVPLFVIVRW